MVDCIRKCNFIISVERKFSTLLMLSKFRSRYDNVFDFVALDATFVFSVAHFEVGSCSNANNQVGICCC